MGDEDKGREISPVVDFTAGTIAGAVGLVVGQPFDVVKVRYQTPQFNGKYSSITGALASILKEEKVPGLFKGVMSPMLGIAFVNGVIFSSYTSFMSLMPTPPGQDPTLWQINLAGMGSGLVGATLTCPIELIKIRQQSMPPHMNPSTFSVAWDILRTGGLRGLYRGYSATLIRESAYGPYFCSYEAVCRYFKWRRAKSGHPLEHHDHKHDLISEGEAELSSGLNWAELMTAGGVAGVVAWVATFPFDVFKTRMQSSSAWGDEASKVKLGLWKTATTSVQKEGWRVMFVGLWPTVVRAIPTNMATFLTFELLVAAMS